MISKITNFPIPKKEQITKRSIHKIRVAYGKADRASTALRRFKPESDMLITRPDGESVVIVDRQKLQERVKLADAIKLLGNKFGVFEGILTSDNAFLTDEIPLVRSALHLLHQHGNERQKKIAEDLLIKYNYSIGASMSPSLTCGGRYGF